MINYFLTGIGACVCAIIGVSFGAGSYDIGKALLSPERRLELKYVRFNWDAQEFEQWLQPVGVSVIKGEWTASIYRNGKHLCSGGGAAPYSGDPVAFDPDVWTGSDCPDVLEKNDTATASWDYRTTDGVIVTLSAKFNLGDYNGK